MCIIIEREPNKTIDFEDFKSFIINNPDGWGLSVPEGDGKLLTLRSAETPDPDNLYKLVQEEFLTHKIMLHLRYTTAGATELRNAHPFPILEKSKDGIDLRMCHNGTLSAYSPQKGNESDTRVFVRQFVRPLFKRLAKAYKDDLSQLLTDAWAKWLLDGELTQKSVLTFIDGNGGTMRVNPLGNGGKVQDGVYYSNVYSFDPEHRLPYHLKANYGVSLNSVGGPKGKSNVVTYTKKHAEDTMQLPFTEQFGTTLLELKSLGDDFIEQLCTENPEDAASLMKELLSRVPLEDDK